MFCVSPQFTSNLIKFFLLLENFHWFLLLTEWNPKSLSIPKDFWSVLFSPFFPASPWLRPFLLPDLHQGGAKSCALIFSFHLEHISPLTAQWVSSKLKCFMNWLLSHELPSLCQWSVTEQSCCRNIFLISSLLFFFCVKSQNTMAWNYSFLYSNFLRDGLENDSQHVFWISEYMSEWIKILCPLK